MKIYACGCSFTYGDELDNPLESAWPMLVAKKLNGSILNDAVSGGTNYRTVYRTIKNLNKDYDLYLIAWTDYSRFTFYKFDNNFEVNFNVQLKNNLYGNSAEFKDFGQLLYRHWYNELFAFKIWLQQIVQLQTVLRDKNYLMINTMQNNLDKWLTTKEKFINSVSNLINFDLMNDEQILEEFEEIQQYIDIIDLSKFYRWGEFFIADLGKQFKTGPHRHILEEGHIHLANLVSNHLNARYI